MHKFVQIDNFDKRLPETVKYYDSTKFSVDITGQLAKKYSVKCESCRWPLHVFYNILDLAAINAWILYMESTDHVYHEKISYFNYRKNLSLNMQMQEKIIRLQQNH